MIKPGRVSRQWLFALLLLGLGGCGGPRERIILLPDPSGHVGRIQVSHAGASVELSEAYAGARIQGSKLAAEQLGEQAVMARYRGVLEGLPASPRRYLLNFEFASDKLTAQSRALLPTILNDLKHFPAPEVLVIGHADAVGTPAINDKLSLDRASRVRDILVAAGIPRQEIQIAGRGAREPLVAAKNGSPEPRNRRVEIKLR